MGRRGTSVEFGWFLLLAFLPGCSAGVKLDPPTQRPIVLKGGVLIDGRGGAPVPDAVVVIVGERIEAVGTAAEVAIPEGAEVIELAGRTLLPGLIDMHAHVTFLTAERKVDPEVTAATAAMLLSWGITSALNPSAPIPEGVELRDRLARSELAGPRLLTAGASWDLIAARGSIESLQAEVRRQCEAGVDFVKLYSPHQPDEVAAVIEAAHRCGVRVIGHLQRTTWIDAARSGIDLITHGASWSADHLEDDDRAHYLAAIRAVGGMKARIDWLERVDLDHPSFAETIAELAARRIPVDPTLVAYETKFVRSALYTSNPEVERTPRLMVESWEQGGFTGDWTDGDFDRMEAVWPKLLELTRRYHEGGMLLTVGSDLPNQWVVPGWSLHREMQLLVEAGIPAAEVLQMATRNGAMALGLTDRGTIERGKLADLVVLCADPLADIGNTMRLESVWQGGVRIAPQGAGCGPEVNP
jgi:imidazolonepropionase-like amidohydrolase